MKKKLNQTEIKTIQLEMLKSVHDFCEANKIDYFLVGGSLLGAVRHKGMIPWDDDIDIGMTRVNYDKFIQTYNSQEYTLFSNELNRQFLLPFAKLSDNSTTYSENYDFGVQLGINIDIFPIDKLPGDIKKAKKFIKKMKFQWNLIVCAVITEWKSRTVSKRIAIVATKIGYSIFKNQNKVTKKTIRNAKKYQDRECEYSACVVWGYGLKEINHSSIFNETIFADFENFKVRILKDYDTYLKGLYGDYMTPPPISEQVYKHGATVYYK